MDNVHEAWTRLARFVERTMELEDIPGVALAVTDHGHGLRDIAAQSPLTLETLFEIGSPSKSLSALVILQEMYVMWRKIRFRMPVS